MYVTYIYNFEVLFMMVACESYVGDQHEGDLMCMRHVPEEDLMCIRHVRDPEGDLMCMRHVPEV